MPRRLGDDPLSRARSGQPASTGQKVLQEPRSSYNDVFFQRRAPDEAPAQPEPETEAAEISEISEIPEIREAAAQAAAPAIGAPTAPVELTPPGEPVEPAPASAETEPAAAASSSPDAQAPNDAPADTTGARPGAEAPPVDRPGEEEQRGGLLKRIFGKFK